MNLQTKLKVLELIPIMWISCTSVLDLLCGYSVANYFVRAKKQAHKKIAKKLGVDTSGLRFDCFKEALVRKSQSNFLEQLLMQCLLSALFAMGVDSSLSGVANPKGLLYSLIFLGIILAGLLAYTVISPSPFAWYHPRDKRIISWLRAMLGRGITLFSIFAVIYAGFDFWTPFWEALCSLFGSVFGYMCSLFYGTTDAVDNISVAIVANPERVVGGVVILVFIYFCLAVFAGEEEPEKGSDEE